MSGQEPIRVMSVDDHPATSAGLAFFLEAYPDVLLVGQAESGEQALKMCEQVQPDVILMDLRLPGMDGVATTAALKQRYPHVRVIVLSSFHDKSTVESVVRAGAIGYLIKSSSAQELIYAIRAAHTGRSVLSQEATSTLVKSLHKPSGWGLLTEREQEVVALLAEGLTNAEIAQKLECLASHS